MDKEDREATRTSFMTDPGVVVVATIAFGRASTRPTCVTFLHTDLPGSVEAYYQEIGRAGP